MPLALTWQLNKKHDKILLYGGAVGRHRCKHNTRVNPLSSYMNETLSKYYLWYTLQNVYSAY